MRTRAEVDATRHASASSSASSSSSASTSRPEVRGAAQRSRQSECALCSAYMFSSLMSRCQMPASAHSLHVRTTARSTRAASLSVSRCLHAQKHATRCTLATANLSYT